MASFDVFDAAIGIINFAARMAGKGPQAVRWQPVQIQSPLQPHISVSSAVFERTKASAYATMLPASTTVFAAPVEMQTLGSSWPWSDLWHISLLFLVCLLLLAAVLFYRRAETTSQSLRQAETDLSAKEKSLTEGKATLETSKSAADAEISDLKQEAKAALEESMKSQASLSSAKDRHAQEVAKVEREARENLRKLHASLESNKTAAAREKSDSDKRIKELENDVLTLHKSLASAKATATEEKSKHEEHVQSLDDMRSTGQASLYAATEEKSTLEKQVKDLQYRLLDAPKRPQVHDASTQADTIMPDPIAAASVAFVPALSMPLDRFRRIAYIITKAVNDLMAVGNASMSSQGRLKCQNWYNVKPGWRDQQGQPTIVESHNNLLREELAKELVDVDADVRGWFEDIAHKLLRWPKYEIMYRHGFARTKGSVKEENRHLVELLRKFYKERWRGYVNERGFFGSKAWLEGLVEQNAFDFEAKRKALTFDFAQKEEQEQDAQTRTLSPGEMEEMGEHEKPRCKIGRPAKKEEEVDMAEEQVLPDAPAHAAPQPILAPAQAATAPARSQMDPQAAVFTVPPEAPRAPGAYRAAGTNNAQAPNFAMPPPRGPQTPGMNVPQAPRFAVPPPRGPRAMQPAPPHHAPGMSNPRAANIAMPPPSGPQWPVMSGPQAPNFPTQPAPRPGPAGMHSSYWAPNIAMPPPQGPQRLGMSVHQAPNFPMQPGSQGMNASFWAPRPQ